MFIELVDALRCPADHEESHLIASASQMSARHVLEGELGCPVCHARYPIEGGEARFTGTPALQARSSTAPRADAEDGMRCAALLALDGPGGFAILEGLTARFAEAVAAIVGDVPLMLLNPPAGIRAMPGISIVRAGAKLPLAQSSARGAATGDANPALLGELARVLRDGGRLIAPAAALLPEGIHELAHDDREWVAEKRPTPKVVSIGRGVRM